MTVFSELRRLRARRDFRGPLVEALLFRRVDLFEIM